MEGPSLVILRKELAPFIGKRIVESSGNTRLGAEQFTGEILKWAKTWGKHLLLRIGKTTIRIHFLLWGSYTIDKRKDRSATLTLQFENGELNCYSSAIRLIEQPLDEIYDWRVDVMSRRWDPKYVRTLVKAQPDAFVADVLLNQNIFAGVGNIIKNEVLHTLKLYPERRIKDLKPRELTALVEEAHRYSHQFYRWKKRYVLRKHWRVYHKGRCPDCEGKLIASHMGKGERYTYYCPTCQPATIAPKRQSLR